MNSDGSMFFGGGLMWVFWILLAVAIIWVIKISMGGTSNNSSDSPKEILKKRYARGEINETEYKRLREELEK